MKPAVDRGLSVEELGLASRSVLVLRQGGIETLGDLVDKTPMDLRILRGFGDQTLRDVVYRLAEVGTHLARAERPREVDALARGWEIIRVEMLERYARDE